MSKWRAAQEQQLDWSKGTTITFWKGDFLVRRVNYTMGKGVEAAVGASRKIKLVGGDDKVEKYTWEEVKKHVS